METEQFKGAEESLLRYKENVVSLTQDFELGLFLYLLNKIKWYAILILLISISSAFFYLRYTPKTYESSALIPVRRRGLASGPVPSRDDFPPASRRPAESRLPASPSYLEQRRH